MEITEFFTTETLEAIDWGVLDLREFNVESVSTLYFFEALLKWELKENYLKNNSGIFGVTREGDVWKYEDAITSQVIVSDSICQLKSEVIRTDNIWYVFDEFLAREVIL